MCKILFAFECIWKLMSMFWPCVCMCVRVQGCSSLVMIVKSTPALLFHWHCLQSSGAAFHLPFTCSSYACEEEEREEEIHPAVICMRALTHLSPGFDTAGCVSVCDPWPFASLTLLHTCRLSETCFSYEIRSRCAWVCISGADCWEQAHWCDPWWPRSPAGRKGLQLASAVTWLCSIRQDKLFLKTAQLSVPPGWEKEREKERKGYDGVGVGGWGKGERDARWRNEVNKNKGTINQRNSVSFWICLCRIFPDALQKKGAVYQSPVGHNKHSHGACEHNKLSVSYFMRARSIWIQTLSCWCFFLLLFFLIMHCQGAKPPSVPPSPDFSIKLSSAFYTPVYFSFLLPGW